MSIYLKGVVCPRCGSVGSAGDQFEGCPRCRKQSVAVNLSTFYEYGRDRETLRGRFLSQKGGGLWERRDFLPVSESTIPVTLGEGNTPLLRCGRLGNALGFDNLYIKNESQNPTWSFKDRLSSVGVTMAAEEKAPVVTVSSTGNHGAAVAAYAAAAGIPCVIFTLADVPDIMKTLMQSYGAYVFALSDSSERWRIMEWCVKNRGWYPLSGYNASTLGSNCYALDGYKSIAFEIYDQMGGLPEYIVVPNAYSDGLYGIWKGVRDLCELGLSDQPSRMVSAEAGLGSLKATLEQKADQVVAVAPTPSAAFSIGNEVGTWQGFAAVKESGGFAEAAEDDAMIRMQQLLARTEGIYAELSSVSSLVVASKLLEQHRISSEDQIVAILTSTGLKDPNETARHLPCVPVIKPDAASLSTAMKASYGIELI